ncbi:MAG TPA: hypothetical protein VGC09_13235, partial [Rhodopila sp.]
MTQSVEPLLRLPSFRMNLSATLSQGMTAKPSLAPVPSSLMQLPALGRSTGAAAGRATEFPLSPPAGRRGRAAQAKARRLVLLEMDRPAVWTVPLCKDRSPRRTVFRRGPL